MILVSSGFGLLLEFWKVRKAVKSVSLRSEAGQRLPSLTIVPADTYTFSETKVYDEEAMRYLTIAIYPLIVGYSLYSLAYQARASPNLSLMAPDRPWSAP